MLRKDREITDFSEIVKIIEKCKVCRVGLIDGDMPYVLPLNFGYDVQDGVITVYFHSARAGLKLDILRSRPNACFEVDCEHGLIPSDIACRNGCLFASVIGQGTAEIIEDAEEQAYALNRVLLHEAGREYEIRPAMTKIVTLWKIRLDRVYGKRRDKL